MFGDWRNPPEGFRPRPQAVGDDHDFASVPSRGNFSDDRATVGILLFFSLGISPEREGGENGLRVPSGGGRKAIIAVDEVFSVEKRFSVRKGRGSSESGDESVIRAILSQDLGEIESGIAVVSRHTLPYMAVMMPGYNSQFLPVQRP